MTRDEFDFIGANGGSATIEQLCGYKPHVVRGFVTKAETYSREPVFTHDMYLYDKFKQFLSVTGKSNCSLTYSENHEFISEFRQWLKDYEDQQQHEEEENRKLYLKLKSEAESANMDFWAYVENQKFNQL
jgi:hypothetical protein